MRLNNSMENYDQSVDQLGLSDDIGMIRMIELAKLLTIDMPISSEAREVLIKISPHHHVYSI